MRTSTGNWVTFWSTTACWLDLLDFAPKRAAPVRLDRETDRLPRVDAADVGLVDVGANSHRGKVGHAEEGGAAGDVGGRRGDDLTRLDLALEDRARDRRADRDVASTLTGELEVGLGTDHRRVGRRRGILRGVELLLGDHAIGQQLAQPLDLGGGDARADECRCEVGFGLVESVLDIPGVDLHQQRRGRDEIAGFGEHPPHLARGARLDLDHANRLDLPARLDHDLEVAPVDGRGGRSRRRRGLAPVEVGGHSYPPRRLRGRSRPIERSISPRDSSGSPAAAAASRAPATGQA